MDQDSRECDMAPVTDFKEIRVIDNNDDSKVITKEQLVKVLEELIHHPDSPNGILTTGVDLDNIKKTGMYNSQNCIHQPAPAKGWYGILKVENYAGRTLQRFSAPDAGANYYERIFGGSTWGDWVMVTLTRQVV